MGTFDSDIQIGLFNMKVLCSVWAVINGVGKHWISRYKKLKTRVCPDLHPYFSVFGSLA